MSAPPAVDKSQREVRFRIAADGRVTIVSGQHPDALATMASAPGVHPICPVVCLDMKCNRLSWHQADWLKLNGSVVKVEALGPLGCAHCGHDAKFIDGTYKHIKGEAQLIFSPASPADEERFRRAAALLKNAVTKQEEPSALIAKANQLLPSLASLWKLLPTNKDELYKFIPIALGLLTFLRGCPELSKPKSEVVFPQEVVDAIQTSRQRSLVDSRKERRKQREQQQRERRR